MKKLNALVILPALVGSIIFGSSLGSNLTYAHEGGFSDVVASDSYYDAVQYLHEQGIVSGYADATYKPQNSINRAEFTKIVVAANFTQDEIKSCDTAGFLFKDTAVNSWYAPYLCVAKKHNLVSGYDDGTVRPSNYISFSEAAKIVAIANGAKPQSAAVWYQPYTEYLSAKNAIPTSLKSFAQKVSRGEMAEMVYRLHANKTSDESLSYEDLNESSVSNAKSYKDIDYGYGEGLLPLGDQKISTEPKVGFIYSCQTQMNGGGAFEAGPWMNEAGGYWDPSQKVTVSGDVNWPTATFTLNTSGNYRQFVGNGLPINHSTGVYPVAQSDDAYQYDRNPNSIKTQSFTVNLPLNPVLANVANCAMGTVGITISGVPIFNGFDAGGRDAVAHEVQDDCGGHPQISGQYHYHNLSTCLPDTSAANEHSDLVGYALDGFGIYGLKGDNGQILKNEDLDGCHGHTHEIEWNGKKVSMYHYHATSEFPYTIGCFRGTVDMAAVSGFLGGGPGGQGGGQGGQGMGPGMQGPGGMGGFWESGMGGFGDPAMMQGKQENMFFPPFY